MKPILLLCLLPALAGAETCTDLRQRIADATGRVMRAEACATRERTQDAWEAVRQANVERNRAVDEYHRRECQ